MKQVVKLKKLENLSYFDLATIAHVTELEGNTLYKNDFKNDLMPFISNQNFISDYVDNYLEEYMRYKINIV